MEVKTPVKGMEKRDSQKQNHGPRQKLRQNDASNRQLQECRDNLGTGGSLSHKWC
jgi:hypothetical protein